MLLFKQLRKLWLRLVSIIEVYRERLFGEKLQRINIEWTNEVPFGNFSIKLQIGHI